MPDKLLLLFMELQRRLGKPFGLRWFTCYITACTCRKVKISHIRYRALGPELVWVYRQLAHR